MIDNEAGYADPWDAAVFIYNEAARLCELGRSISVRTFATGTFEDGAGEPLGHNAWSGSEGPLTGKGLSCFTSLEEIPNLLRGFVALSTELPTSTVDNRQHEFREWIIVGCRPGL